MLSGLDRLGPQSAARLGDEVGIDRSGASRDADRLEAAGLIERSPDPCDGRATLLALMLAGRAAVTLLRNALTRHLAGLIEDWPDEQAQALIDGIRLLIDTPRTDSFGRRYWAASSVRRTCGQELLAARLAKADGLHRGDPARSNIAMVDMAGLIQRHSCRPAVTSVLQRLVAQALQDFEVCSITDGDRCVMGADTCRS